jgi:hypothetical protein
MILKPCRNRLLRSSRRSFSSGDGLAVKNVVAMVCEIQQEKLLIKIIDPNTQEFAKDGYVPKLHDLTKTLYCFLHPVEASHKLSKTRWPFFFLELATFAFDHLLHPHVKRSTQLSLFDQKLHELNAHSADYCAA